uniref:Uncharacterized protein n=1 Tax=Schistosoma haematobium TaxID=6185 RepID=A0A095AL96_SCHHA
MEPGSTITNYPYVYNNLSMNYLHSTSPIHLTEETSRRSGNICHPIDNVPDNVDNNNNNGQSHYYFLPSDQQQLTTHQSKREKSLKSNMTPQPYWCLDLGVPVYEAIQPINNMNDVSEPPASPADLPISIPTTYRLPKFAINPNVTNRTGSLPGPIAFISSDLNVPRQMQNSVNINNNNNNSNDTLNQKTWHYGLRPINSIPKDFLNFTCSKQQQQPHQKSTNIIAIDPDQLSNHLNIDFDRTHINSTLNRQEQFMKRDYHSTNTNHLNRFNQWFFNPFNSFRNRIKKLTSTIEITSSSLPKIQIDDISIQSTGTLPRTRNRLKPCSRIFSRKKVTGRK